MSAVRQAERTASGYRQVAGECPMGCGTTLFLGEGGYVTCSLLGCPNPAAADELLRRAAERARDPERGSPRRVAEGAINRLCAYDAVGAPDEYEPTADRVAEFLREFSLIASERLVGVARHQADGGGS